MKRTNFLSMIVFFTILIAASTIHAQNKPAIFERFSTGNGLSQNRIFDITQDKLGFIWIGTEDGLNRYDGYNFKIYKNIPGDSTSLIANTVFKLLITQSGDLWISNSLYGLSKFNSENETFINYQNDHSDPNTLISNRVRDISEDKKGNLWICTHDKGFDYLDVSTGKFYHMTNMLPPGYIMNNSRYSFAFQDSRENLWIGGSGEVRQFKIEYSQKGIPLLKPVKLNIKIYKASKITEDNDGTIWIGTVANGLYRFDRKSQLLELYRLDNTDFDFNKMLITDIKTEGINTLWLSALYSENGQSAIYNSGYGVLKINLLSKEVQQFKNDPENEKSISSNDISKLFLDRTNVLWAGAVISGINKYDQTGVKFNVYKPSDHIKSDLNVNAIRSFYKDAGKVLWLTA